MEAAPTFFGLQRNHHQGATASAKLKLQEVLWHLCLHSAQHAPHRSFYAAIALTASARRLSQL
jgi:hypothetical protein